MSEVRFTQLAAGPDADDMGHTLYGLTADGRVYTLSEASQQWVALPMREYHTERRTTL